MGNPNRCLCLSKDVETHRNQTNNNKKIKKTIFIYILLCWDICTVFLSLAHACSYLERKCFLRFWRCCYWMRFLFRIKKGGIQRVFTFLGKRVDTTRLIEKEKIEKSVETWNIYISYRNGFFGYHEWHKTDKRFSQRAISLLYCVNFVFQEMFRACQRSDLQTIFQKDTQIPQNKREIFSPYLTNLLQLF